MLPQQPIVFVSKSFFIDFCKCLQRTISEVPIEEKKRLLFLEDLLFSRSTVMFNIPESAISESVNKALSNTIVFSSPGEDETIFNLNIAKISTNLGRVKSCEEEFRDYRNFDTDRIGMHSIQPHFIFVSDTDEIAKNVRDKYGIICFSGNLKSIPDSLFNVYFKQINQNDSIEPSDFFSKIQNSNTVIIEEPYILKQEYDFIKKFILALIRETICLSPCKILLITKTSEGNLSFINRLKTELAGKFQIEHYEKTNIHDRNIYGNSFWVTSDYGFMKKYSKSATKWTSFPLGVYYSEYYERLRMALTFLKNEKNKSCNYLAIGFNQTAV